MNVALLFDDLFLRTNISSLIAKLGHTPLLSGNADDKVIVDLAIVDLDRISDEDLTHVAYLYPGKTLGFYSHKNAQSGIKGKKAGIETVPRSHVDKKLHLLLINQT